MMYNELFGVKKPLIGMIHTNSADEYTMLDLAKREIKIFLQHGIYPLIENYFGSTDECEMVLAWIQKAYTDAVYGVNILGNYQEAFRLAAKYGARFIQIDSVCGHLAPEYDEEYARRLAELRSQVDVVLLGGVRFKYQPVNSGRSLEEDLRLGSERCDAIVCTGEGTGVPTPLGKVKEFKAVLPDFPVIVGAGVTIETVQDTFQYSDGAIIGSWIKDEHLASCCVNETYVRMITDRIIEN